MTQGINDIRFGIEIEMVHPQNRIAAILAEILMGSIHARCYSHQVTSHDGRVWNVVEDGSVNGASGCNSELVSPILTLADLPTLRMILDALKADGAKVDSSTGIHIHVDGEAITAVGLANLVKMVAKNEDLLYQAFGVLGERESWCRKMEDNFIKAIDGKGNKLQDKEEVKADWYGRYGCFEDHYDSSRYHGLNLHSLYYRGTVEFRYFNSSLDADTVTAYVHFILSLVAKANKSKRASSKKRVVKGSVKYAFRCLMIELEMKGAEFKVSRKVLMASLPGGSAKAN